MQNPPLKNSVKSTMSSSLKKYKIKILQPALDEIDGLCAFIQKNSSRQASIFLDNIWKKISSLKTFPYRGARAKVFETESLSLEVRFLEYKGYLVLYTIESSGVIILHVTGPGQDWISLF